jgi:16S rRNA (guanine527-N7)-methyltransferase
MTPEAALDRGLDALRLELPREARASLLAFLALLTKWNRTHNLTAIRDPLRMVSHHLLDSLAVLPHLPPGRLADIGSGAGLPGIPIAISDPGRAVVLNDSNHKKGAFLRQAAIELGLHNAQVHTGRVEDWQPAEHFAVVISRGFAALADFCAAAGHLVMQGGALAAMKGALVEQELKQAPQGCNCAAPIRLHVPLLEGERHLVLCRPGIA